MTLLLEMTFLSILFNTKLNPEFALIDQFSPQLNHCNIFAL